MAALSSQLGIAFIGAGNMAEALVRGLIESQTCEAQQITAADIRSERRALFAETFGVTGMADAAAAVKAADVAVLCTKPQSLPEVLRALAPVSKDKLFISIAAGVPIESLETSLGDGTRVVRAMPNTPALIGAGATALSAGSHASEKDLELATRLFASVGLAVTVPEDALDAVTGLSGSGPAYVFLIIEALSDAGVKVGLHRGVAQALAAQTVRGSADLLIQTGEHPGKLKDQVTSPGGTAIAGLHTLEQGSLRTTLINAVESATQRARELGAAFASTTARKR